MDIDICTISLSTTILDSDGNEGFIGFIKPWLVWMYAFFPGINTGPKV